MLINNYRSEATKWIWIGCVCKYLLQQKEFFGDFANVILILYLEAVKIVHRDENRCASDMFCYEREKKKQRHKHRKSHRNDIIALWVTNTQSLRIHSNIKPMNVARATVFRFFCYVVSMFILFIGAECLYSLCSFFCCSKIRMAFVL